MSTLNEEWLAEILQEVRNEFNRTTENLGDDATRADYYADAAARLEFITGNLSS